MGRGASGDDSTLLGGGSISRRASPRLVPTPLRLPLALTRPSYLYLLLFVAQLVVSFVWLASMQREQHAADLATAHTSLSISSTGGNAVTAKLLAMTMKTKCDLARSEASTDAGCNARVHGAILQLEELKTQLHTSRRPQCPAVAPATAQSVAATSGGVRRPLLVIGIPSMPRTNVDYLTLTLAALDRQLLRDPTDPMFDQVQVWVMNNGLPDRAPHASFEHARKQYADRTAFRFLTNDHSLQDEKPLARDVGSSDTPGYRVRKQTRDIAHLMHAVRDQSQYFLAMEDDFEICPNSIGMLLHMIRKTTHADALSGGETTPMTDWITMKMGYGFNGFMLKNNQDLQEFARYLLEHQARRPPVRRHRTHAHASKHEQAVQRHSALFIVALVACTLARPSSR